MRTIAVTGGDASGKTDSWQRLNPKLKAKILQVPEIATALMSQALPILGLDIEVTPEILSQYQGVFRNAQRVSEDMWKTVATIQGKKLVWCDRGIPDLVAYDPGGWPAIEAAFQMSRSQVYDRYDRVILLRSLAYVDPDLYRKVMASNPSRTPRTIEQATELDERIYQAWKNHPGLIEIDCGVGIDSIVDQIEREVRSIVDIEIEKKYDLKLAFPNLSEFEEAVRTTQRQGYVVNNDKGEIRARRIEVRDGPTSYLLTTKCRGFLERYEHEDEDFTEAGYEIAQQSFVGAEIVKARYICRRDGVIYEIDHYRSPEERVIVEVNFDNARQAEEFEANRPSWLSDARDVTDIQRFKAAMVAYYGTFPKEAVV